MTRRGEARQRRLAAVVFTDIVGYSALVNTDEATAEHQLVRHRRLVRSLLPRFDGREIETAGDSFLLIFNSALAALRCVCAIHRALAADPPTLHGGAAVQLRASIHVGDIEHRGREVYGDGVNVAARLLPLAPPAGIALSDTAYSQVRHRLEVEPQSLGPQTLKNIRYPVPVLTFSAEQAATIEVESRTGAPNRRGEPRASAWRVAMVFGAAGLLLALALGYTLSRLYHSAEQPPKTAVGDRRTVAVLPFATFSKGEGDELLSNGIQDSVLTDLARIQALRVISRTSVSAFRNLSATSLHDIAAQLGAGAVLEGSVQRQGDRIFVQAQLIDANNDQHLWAQSYDRHIDDLFAAESDIAQQVAEAIQVKLSADERSAIERKPTTDPQAYGEYVQAQQLMDDAVTKDSLEQARQHLDQALKPDPDFALAHMASSRNYLYRYFINLERTDECLAKARDELLTAQQLAPGLPELHIGWGRYYFIGRWEMDTAEAEFRTALQSLPNSVEANSALGTILQDRGELQEAFVYQRRALELNPKSPGQYVKVVKTMMMLRDYRGASHVLDRAERNLPGQPQIQEMRLSLDLLSGDIERAKADAATARTPEEQEKLAYFAGDFDEAIRQVMQRPEWLGNISGADVYPREVSVGYYLWLKGDRAAAVAHLRMGAAMLEKRLESPGEASWEQNGSLALAYAALGQEAQARTLLKKIDMAQVTNPEARVSVMTNEAATLVALGDAKGAIRTLRDLLSRPSFYSSSYLEIDPAYKPLRGEADFKKLVADTRASETGRL